MNYILKKVHQKSIQIHNLYTYFKISSIEWYNIIAGVYDFLGDFYKRPRIEFINNLGIKQGDIVLDLCTGTGRNVSYLAEKVGKKGKVFAIDSSKGMLELARKRFYNQTNVHFINVDCEDLTVEVLKKYKEDIEQVDHIFCSLGYSVMENPKIVYGKSFRLLKHNGQYAIMDLFSEKSNFLSAIIDFLAFAQSKRKSWKIIENNCKDIYHKRYNVMSGEIFVISGRKK